MTGLWEQKYAGYDSQPGSYHGEMVKCGRNVCLPIDLRWTQWGFVCQKGQIHSESGPLINHLWLSALVDWEFYVKAFLLCLFRLNEKGYSELVCKEKPEAPPLALTEDLEKKALDPPSSHHKTAQHFSDHSTHSEPSALAKNKSSVLLPHLEKYKCPEGTPPPLSKFQEVQPGLRGGVLASLSPVNNQSSTPLSVPVPWKGSEQHSKRPTREEELQQELVPPPFPPPPPPAVLPTQQTAGPTQPTMEGQRSPSPQFAPQRLTDKPPVSVSIQDEAPGR